MGVYAGGNYGGGFNEGAFVPSVYPERSPSHPHICHRAKFEILLLVSTLTPADLWGPLYVSLWEILVKSVNRRPSYSDFTILPFRAHFGVPFAPTDLRVKRTHPNRVGTLRYANHWSLAISFIIPKSLPVRNGGAPNRSGIEICSKFWTFLPLIKMGNG